MSSGKFTEAEKLGLAWSKLQKEKTKNCAGGNVEYVEYNPLRRGNRHDYRSDRRDTYSRVQVGQRHKSRSRSPHSHEKSGKNDHSATSHTTHSHDLHKVKKRKKKSERCKEDKEKLRHHRRRSSRSRSRSGNRRRSHREYRSRSGSLSRLRSDTIEESKASFRDMVYKDYQVGEANTDVLRDISDRRSRSGSRSKHDNRSFDSTDTKYRKRSKSRSRSRNRDKNRKRYRSSSRSTSPIGEGKWTHSGFIKRAIANVPSPERNVPSDYIPPKERWVSRAGGVAIMKTTD